MSYRYEPYRVNILRVLSRKNFRKVLHNLNVRTLFSIGYTTSELADVTRMRSVEVSRILRELKVLDIAVTDKRRHYFTEKGATLWTIIENEIEDFRTSSCTEP